MDKGETRLVQRRRRMCFPVKRKEMRIRIEKGKNEKGEGRGRQITAKLFIPDEMSDSGATLTEVRGQCPPRIVCTLLFHCLLMSHKN